MTLEVGTDVTIWYSGNVSEIGKIDRVTAKRAYSGSREFKREIGNADSLTMIGLGTWSHYSAGLTTDAHRKELATRRNVGKAKKYFEELIRDQEAMLIAYDKLVTP